MTDFSSVSCWRAGLGWVAAAAIGVSTVATTPARAATSQEVDAAVDKAVAYILKQQKADGSWEAGPQPKPGLGGEDRHGWITYGGETAAAVYALLVAGVRPSTPEMRKAIEWLETHDMHGTYVIGFRSQCWNEYVGHQGKMDRPFTLVRDHDKDFVLFSRIQRGPSMGFYSYVYGADMGGSMNSPTGPGGFTPYDPKGPVGNGYDRSNSQYGVLAAWGLEQAGAEIPTQYWLDEDAAWKKAQLPDGGWDYSSNAERGATPTMTCAGLATLFITQDYVLRTNFHQFDTCKGGVTNSNIEKGLAWMDKHIGGEMGKGGAWGFYLTYGIERVGVASGRKYFGTVDWYKEGADSIVKTQPPTGGWATIHDTCWATVFLCRGRAPVMMNKVIYETNTKKQVDPWNERPRDVANLAKWMGKSALEGFLNWQIVNLQVPVSDLHDAPILYMSGSEDLALSNQDIEKLRLFVEQGGMILGNADCGSKNFTQSFYKLGNKLFPKYEFRKLPPSHPIFNEQFHAAKWKVRQTVEGLSNGVRELMIIVPETDMGKAWQTESTKVHEESFQLAGNIFLYAVGRENLEHKGDTYIVEAEGEAGREIKVARVQAGENWDPEPGAWRRLSAILHNNRHVDIKPEPVKLGDGKLADYKIAALTGTTKLILNANQREELKSFVTKGGTLIIDAAGGASDFADTAENELKQMFGKAATDAMAEPLPATHAIYTDPADKVDQIKYRYYARHLLTGGAHAARVRGVMVGGRIGVFFSREDLTAGCVGEPVDGVIGYDPKTSTQIMGNIVMFAEAASKGEVVAAPAPPAASDHTASPAPETTAKP